MALFTPSESPAVVVKEIDLTGGVPNVQSTTGAIVINSRWGPAEERKLIANETELIDTFASPDSSTTFTFHEASMFLKYSSSLQVVRILNDSCYNAVSTTGQTSSAESDGLPSTIQVKNEAHFTSQRSGLDSDQLTFVAKYPGALGNSLQVSICGFDSGNDAFNGWPYKSEFDAAPTTSSYAAKLGAKNDEVHAVVIDRQGQFSGTKGTVLERYAFNSLGKDAKNTNGTTNYIKDIINENSEYVWLVGFDSDYSSALGNAGTYFNSVAAGTTVDSGDNFARVHLSDSAEKLTSEYNFSSGTNVNNASLKTSHFLSGFDLFEDKDQVEIDFLIAPDFSVRDNHVAVVNDLVSTAQSLRKDCVVVASPSTADVVNRTSASDITDEIVLTADKLTKSSYLVMDGNFLKIYDKFNDQFIEIPAASSTAGIMAATDLNRAPWFSPAGSRRGQYLGITNISFSPTKGQRDSLYKAGVNPIANIPGAGVILFGDKTKLARPSAFDRINVRRLFLVLERAIGRAAEQVLFEFNDEFTRAEFVNIIEPVLREVKGRRGITDFRVVADATNNTPEVIDRNEFRADIFIKPARSINYVTLNFVAVRTGVDFEEVVGTV